MNVRSIIIALIASFVAAAGEPVRTAWIMSPGSAAASAPEVHSVALDGKNVVVRSAGLSLKYLGPLETAPVPVEGPREFVYEIPAHPEAAGGRHERVPANVIGTFVNGLPIYNQFEALSWNGSNLWHYDAVALKDDGTVTASGHARRELTHPATAGLVEELIRNTSRHSPLIGFALDGYPIYGPWGYANADGTGGLKRMRSSYRLRAIDRRRVWPDGTKLTPEQFGPDVDDANPLGSFAEDFEFVKGAGDLDEFNGRFAGTPEYPEGTYAYYLTTDAAGKLAFPYLIGPRFFGKIANRTDEGWQAASPAKPKSRLSLFMKRGALELRFRLVARDASGEAIRHFEYVHERPIHFVIVSEDLAEFSHIHPELAADDSWQVSWTFAHGGRYRIWADYSLPGEAPHLDEFEVNIDGPCAVDTGARATDGSFGVELTSSRPLRAGEDIPVSLRLTGPTSTLEPYLGAWAHVVVIGGNPRSFAHAHPLEPAGVATMVHSHSDPGPPPREIHIVTNFPTSGMYKLWAQFQQAGVVVTVPFVLQVMPAAASNKPAVAVPAGAIRISVTQHGYEPAQVTIPANTPVTLAFTRDASPTCASEVVFPALGIRKALPPNETVLVDLPAQRGGEIGFACGMGMFRGMLVAR